MKIKKIVLAGLFLMSGISIASAQIKLSFNPEKGKKYKYQTEIIQNLQQNMMGQNMSTEVQMSVSYVMDVKDKTPLEIHTQFVYQEFVYIVTNPMMKMGYDSKKPVENPSEMDKMLDKIFSKMINQSIMVVFAPDGSVKSVSGMDEFVENMINSVALDGPMAAQMAAQMKQQLGNDALKNSFNQSFKVYPTQTIKKGDSWNMENVIAVANMKTNAKTKYTLKETNKNMATVAVEGEMNMIPDAGMDIIPGGMEGKLAGTQTGTMLFDMKTGLPVTSDISQIMKGVLKAQGMEIQMEMGIKTKASIKEVK